MKLLVGTLHTIENEFDACCAAIQSQTYRDFDHVVIHDLPNREAHHALYGRFMEKADEYDLLVKIDADMVIRDRDLFAEIVRRFEADPELDLLLIAVHDFFTDQLIMGVNVFRNTVQWDLGEENLFTDRVHDTTTIRKKVKDYDELAPAAWHCTDPAPFQSFHYGFHRGMKAFRGGDSWDVLEFLFDHYRRRPDPRLALALLGANASLERRFSPEHISYTNDTTARYFGREYESMSHEELDAAVHRSRLYWMLRFGPVAMIMRRYYRLKGRR